MLFAQRTLRGVYHKIEIFDVDQNSGNETVQVILTVEDQHTGWNWSGTREAAYTDLLCEELNGITAILIIEWFESFDDMIDEIVEEMVNKESV